MSVELVLVVGAGQMGAGIAQVVASSGRQVLLHETRSRGRSGEADLISSAAASRGRDSRDPRRHLVRNTPGSRNP